MLDLLQTIFLVIGCISSIILLVSFVPFFLPKQKFFPRSVISSFETQMFLRLKQAFPHYHVLTQVAFSALITSDHYKIRSKFNRKVTDFVLLNKDMKVVVIIELDDPSHLGKEQENKQRDQMLQEAGYDVIRYTEIPSIKQLQMDIRS